MLSVQIIVITAMFQEKLLDIRSKYHPKHDYTVCHLCASTSNVQMITGLTDSETS